MASVYFQIPGCFGEDSREGKETLMQIQDTALPSSWAWVSLSEQLPQVPSSQPLPGLLRDSVPTATGVIGAVIFHLELTLCSVSNFKQILFLSLHFRGEKTRPSWVFHCPQQPRVCRPGACQSPGPHRSSTLTAPRGRKTWPQAKQMVPGKYLDGVLSPFQPHLGLSMGISQRFLKPSVRSCY